MDTIATGPAPRFLAAGEGAIWTLNQKDGTVSRIDAKTHKSSQRSKWECPGGGGDIAVGEGSVWVTAFDFPLSRIDPNTNQVVQQFAGPGGDAVRVGLGSIWLSNGQQGDCLAAGPEENSGVAAIGRNVSNRRRTIDAKKLHRRPETGSPTDHVGSTGRERRRDEVVHTVPGKLLAWLLLARADGCWRRPATSRSESPTSRRHHVNYLREVRPILAQHCFQCHGPDEAARKGKLRLDLKSEAFAERKSGRVIAPGDLDGSLVWERITTEDDDERMPPAGDVQPLTKEQIATLKTWIEQGAKWEDHWSFLPPRKPAVPKVSDTAWVRDPLDAFVLARLEREKLKPEAEATREAWLRRVSFDLTGLPPTPAEIDEFLKDKRADAYEKQVDRLLDFAALRRAPGAGVARPGPLRRHERLPERHAPRASGNGASG